MNLILVSLVVVSKEVHTGLPEPRHWGSLEGAVASRVEEGFDGGVGQAADRDLEVISLTSGEKVLILGEVIGVLVDSGDGLGNESQG